VLEEDDDEEEERASLKASIFPSIFDKSAVLLEINLVNPLILN